MNLGTPSSQAAGDCPISFVLKDPTSIGDTLTTVTLAIRPEDLTRQSPSRLSVQQTLGGAWADNFGAGLDQINISGHTGWHRFYGSGRELANQQEYSDGAGRFQVLRATVFDAWHNRRAVAVQRGLDPNSVQLIFADGLHKTTSVVAPVSFVLRRSRSRPLLAQYQIGLVVLSQDLGTGILGSTIPSLLDSALKGPLQAAGLESLLASVDRITKAAKDVSTWVDRTLGAPVKAFMAQTTAIYQRVDAAVRSVNGVADSLILVARDASRAGMNIFHSIAAVANLPTQIRARAMDVAAAYRNAFCVLRNAVTNGKQYESYNSLYGASNCSSTAGGSSLSPFRALNTFSEIQSLASSAGVSVTTSGHAAMSVLAAADVVVAPMSTETLAPLVTSAAAGLTTA